MTQTRRLEQIDQLRDAATKAKHRAERMAHLGDLELERRYRDISYQLVRLSNCLARREHRKVKALEALEKAKWAAGIEDAVFDEVA